MDLRVLYTTHEQRKGGFVYYIAMHAAFNGAGDWAGFLLDEHPYFAFVGVNTSPVNTTGATGQPGGTWPALACNTFGHPTEDA